LTPRDAAAANIMRALDFRAPPRLTAPKFTVAPFVAAGCTGTVASSAGLPSAEDNEWSDLKELAVSLGWSLPA